MAGVSTAEYVASIKARLVNVSGETATDRARRLLAVEQDVLGAQISASKYSDEAAELHALYQQVCRFRMFG